MGIYEFEGRRPIIGERTYVNHTAVIIGKVTIGKQCYIAPGAIVKGDYGDVQIGDGCSVQDNVVIHARPGEHTTIGSNCTLGHGAIIHNAEVKNEAVIGMGAIVSDYAVVGEWAVVGEGAVVRQKFEVPDGAIVVGVPAKVVGEIQAHQKEEMSRFKKVYQDLAIRYPKGLKKLSD